MTSSNQSAQTNFKQQIQTKGYTLIKLEENLYQSADSIISKFTPQKIQKYVSHRMDTKELQIVNMMSKQIRQKLKAITKREVEKHCQKQGLQKKLQVFDELLFEGALIDDMIKHEAMTISNEVHKNANFSDNDKEKMKEKYREVLEDQWDEEEIFLQALQKELIMIAEGV